ncbi:MAG: SPOR domain-containing protein [Pseudomonadota bacterium]|nr:SPOR domain-containing protein [Pseudomonadota bacterium]
MDEFDKIKELSDDIIGRKEPSFEEKESKQIDSPFKDDMDLSTAEEVSEKDITSFKWHFIALGIFVGLIVVVLSGFFLFGEEETSDKVITISPTPEPVRIKPENAGGINIPNQDKLIYNRIQAEMPKVEQLFPEPEKPVLPDNMIPNSDSINTEETKETMHSDTFVQIVPKKEILPLKKEPQTVKTDVLKVQTPVVSPISKVSDQIWRIQLMSSPKKATVEKAWKNILQKHKALLSDMSHTIVSVEIAGKGTFYRLQAGKFATRDQAAALCAKLKAQKQDCVPQKAEK